MATDEPDTLDVSALYAHHARQVWRCLARLGVPPELIEDAVQEVFLTAHERADEFEGRSSALTWLIGITAKVGANTRRRDVRRRPLTLVDPEQLADSERTSEDALARRQQLAALDAALSALSPPQREAVVLHDLEHIAAPELAEALGVSVNTVYSRLRLGRQALARSMRHAEEVSS